jgi:hypothetical protein
MTTRTFFIDLEEPLKGSFRFSDNTTTAIDKTLNRYNKIMMHINVRMELTIGHVGVKAISDPSKTFSAWCPTILDVPLTFRKRSIHTCSPFGSMPRINRASSPTY